MANNSSNPDDENNIENFRKKRRKRLRFRRLATVLLALVGIAAIAILAVKFDFNDVTDFLNKAATQGGETGFPKKLYGDHPKQIEVCGDVLAMVTDSNVYFYSSSGETLQNLQHGYSNPVLASSGGRALLYDRGGNSFEVCSRSGKQYEQTLTNQIISAAINQNGYAAVAATEERYAGSVTVYDADGKQAFKWSSSDYQINGIALSPSGNLVVSCVGAKDGTVISVIYQMSVFGGSDQQVSSVTLPDLMVLSATYDDDGSVCVIGDTKSVILSSACEIKAEYPYSKTISDFNAGVSNFKVLLLSSSYNNSKYDAVTVDGSSQVKGTYTSAETVKWIASSRDHVFLLLNKELLMFDANMNQQKSFEVRSDAEKILVIGSDVYVLGLGEISKISY